MAKTWEVTIPIAGHALLTVRAETQKEAVTIAFDKASLDDVQEWEALHRFTQGNVCYCPSPWEVEAVCVGEDEGAA